MSIPPSIPITPPFDDATAAALAELLRATARRCGNARSTLRTQVAVFDASWRGGAADDGLRRAARLAADLDRCAEQLGRRAEWIERRRSQAAADATATPDAAPFPLGLVPSPLLGELTDGEGAR